MPSKRGFCAWSAVIAKWALIAATSLLKAAIKAAKCLGGNLIWIRTMCQLQEMSPMFTVALHDSGEL